MDEKQQHLNSNHIKFFVLSNIFDVVRLIIKSCFWLSMAYIAYLGLDVIAGKTTVANIIIGYFNSKESDFGAPWVLTLVAFIWAYLERKEKLRKTQELHKRIMELEKRVDPNRTSSGLLPTGETNPKDEVL